MLVVAIDAQILLQRAVDTFYLTVGGWVMSRCKVEAHAEEGAEGSEEVRGKLQAAIGGYVEGDAMLGEDMGDESICDINCGSVIRGGDENTFLGEAIDNDQNRREPIGRRQLFDEVHAY